MQAHYWRLNSGSGREERRAAVKNFYEKQGNRRSSIANGLHISSKLWELGLGILRVPRDPKERERFDRYIHPVDFREETEGRLTPYYNVEHERWMAYVRTEGWRLAAKGGDSLQDIRRCYEEYCGQFKNQNYMMKLHPALVPADRGADGGAVLQEVDDMIAAVNRERGTGRLPPGLRTVGCGSGGSYRRHRRRSLVRQRRDRHPRYAGRARECVICRLDDIGAYCAHLYEQKRNTAMARELLLLEEQIRRCRGISPLTNLPFYAIII